MDEDVVIKVESLRKKFCRSLKRSLYYGSLDIFRDMLGIPYDRGRLRNGEFLALDDINFELRKGEALGIIGQNGSGKTTLLRLINGIFPPDRGVVSVRGRVGALIAVGAGFHPHMSGRENIFLNGAILGMTRKEINEKMQEIIDFADIGEFIEAPVSTYSSGMVVRLGFSIAVSARPSILLVDEILAVGDMKFQQKCMTRIAELMDAGTSVVLISHQMVTVQKVCKRGLLLEHGKIICSGHIDEVINQYYTINSSNDTIALEAAKIKNISSFNITYRYLKFLNSKGEETREFESGEDIIVEWSFKMAEAIKDVVVHFSLADSPYTYNCYVSSYDGVKIEEIDDRTVIRLVIKKASLSAGNYAASIGLWDKNFIGSYFWDYESTGFIRIKSQHKIPGRFSFEHEWEINKC